MDFHRPGFRFMAQSFVGFILHSSPVARTIKRIQFFCGYMIRWKELFREIFQIHFPLSFFLMVTSGWKYFLRSRFRDRQIAATFCLIKEGQLAVYGIQRFRVFSETIAVRYAHLFDQPFNVLIQCVQLSLHHKNDGDQFFPAAVIQFFQCCLLYTSISYDIILFFIHLGTKYIKPCSIIATRINQASFN